MVIRIIHLMDTYGWLMKIRTCCDELGMCPLFCFASKIFMRNIFFFFYLFCYELLDLFLSDIRAIGFDNKCDRDFSSNNIFHSEKPNKFDQILTKLMKRETERIQLIKCNYIDQV